MLRDVGNARVETRVDDGFASGHGLDLDDAEGFTTGDGRKDKRVGRMVKGGYVVVLDLAKKGHAITHAVGYSKRLELAEQRARTDQQQASADVAHGFNGVFKAFVVDEPPNANQKPITKLATYR